MFFILLSDRLHHGFYFVLGSKKFQFIGASCNLRDQLNEVKEKSEKTGRNFLLQESSGLGGGVAATTEILGTVLRTLPKISVG